MTQDRRILVSDHLPNLRSGNAELDRWVEQYLQAFVKQTFDTLKNVTSGSYTPTATNVANCAALSPATAYWFRVGDMVHVSGRVNIDPTSATTLTQMRMSLPIPSAMTSAADLSGVGARSSSTSNMPVNIFADTTNDEAQFSFYNDTDTADNVYTYAYSYGVVG